MRLKNWNPDAPHLRNLRDELRQLYGGDIEVFAGRHHAKFNPGDIPIHVISRVFQGRHLLKPNRQLRRIIAGVLGRAQRKYPELILYAAVFLSNHLHFMLQATADVVAKFMAMVKREITKRWGQRPEINWIGTMWHEYLSTALPTERSQIRCLKYILSHGVKEGLVDKPQLWPGVHCAKQLLGLEKLVGEWFNGTDYSRACDAQNRKKHPRPVNKNSYYIPYEVKFTAIPPWAHLSEREQREKVRAMVDEIVEEGRTSRDGKPALGVKKILAIPLNHRTELPKQPWFEDRRRMICWADPCSPEVKAYLDRYWAFQRAFREASTALREGNTVVSFPPGAFLPGRFKSADPPLS